MKESARILFSLGERPTEGELRQLSTNWSPWRSVAALLLWDYYSFAKNRKASMTRVLKSKRIAPKSGELRSVVVFFMGMEQMGMTY